MVRLFPGKEEVVDHHLPAAARRRGPIGTRPFAVRVQPRQEPGVRRSRRASSRWAPLPTAQRSSYRKFTWQPERSARGAVDNHGNASLQAALRQATRTSCSTSSSARRRLVVAPAPPASHDSGSSPGKRSGAASRSRARSRSASSPRAGPRSSWTAPGPGSAALAVDAARALGLVAVLIAATVLWFLAVKPGIESIARDAVTRRPPWGAPAVAAATRVEGKSPSPLAAATPTSPSGPGVNFAQRLAPAGPGLLQVAGRTRRFRHRPRVQQPRRGERSR